MIRWMIAMNYTYFFYYLTFLGNWSTHYKWIPSESIETRTCGCMTNDVTNCSYSTNSIARISTLSLYTCLISRAFWINWTFGSAIGWCSYICWQTSTRCLTINVTAFWIRSARWRCARVHKWTRFFIFSYGHTNISVIRFFLITCFNIIFLIIKTIEN